MANVTNRHRIKFFRIFPGQRMSRRNVSSYLFGKPANKCQWAEKNQQKKKLLPGAVKHPATLMGRQHHLPAENHHNSPSEIINRNQKMTENAEIQ